MNKLEKREGFTIIEVVLVLAIAGLIFLIVFLAVPALQRSQRDTQRRNDVSRFMAQIQNYAANNKGCVPVALGGAAAAGCPGTDVNAFVSSYLDNGSGVPDNWKDPTTGALYSAKNADVTSASAAGDFYYATANKCDGETLTAVAGGTRKAAIRMKLEGAGFLCQNN